MATVPEILVSSGEPAGIGPDICLQLAQRDWPARLVVAADADMLRQRAERLRLNIRWRDAARDRPGLASRRGELQVLHRPLRHGVSPGRLDSANAAYVLDLLREGCLGCLDGRYQALVTAPVHKGVINDAGIAFSGHTETLAEWCDAWPVMMLATRGLRVALATTHLPLREVPDAITEERLERVIRVLFADLRRRFGIARPRLLVAGLNPHAGEGGHLGTEEQRLMTPLFERLRGEGLDLSGPWSADTLFTPERIAASDAILAMYHDQGLPVLKHLGFGRSVNVTLGLPIVRTSVDHGTALELAATGNASAESLFAAVEMALEMTRLGPDAKPV